MSTPKNSYVTPAEFLQWVTPLDTTADTVDDAVIANILEAVSRYCDGQCNRKFYPTVETQTFDVPEGRSLFVDDDLSEVLSVTNGDGSTVASTYYNLYPPNQYPKDEIRLTETSNLFWSNSSTSYEQVIDIDAIWAYRERYNLDGWESGGTLGAAISDTSTLAFTATAGHSLAAGQVIRIDDELQVINTVVTNTITPFKRGDNGSTAATHDNGTTVYVWQPQEDLALACKHASRLHRTFIGAFLALMRPLMRISLPPRAW